MRSITRLSFIPTIGVLCAPMFDPNLFLQQTVDAPLETEFKRVDEGEYTAHIGDFNERTIEAIDFTYKKGPKTGQPGQMIKFNCPFVLTGPEADVQRQKLNKAPDEKLLVFKSIILELDDNGAIATGVNKNVELGRIQAAAKQGGPGWNLTKLAGAGPMMIKVIHRSGKSNDGKEFTTTDVDRVTPIS